MEFCIAMEPLVTVIIPAYNHEKYIEECLESVINQTYPNLEIIVINDGSKDNTDSIIRRFVALKSRNITYLSKENEGLCKTLNIGLEMTHGKYVSFIASDDAWLPSRIEEGVLFLESNRNIGMVFSDAFFTNFNEKSALKYSEYKPKIKKLFKNSIQNSNIYEAMLVENIVLALTVLIRKECIDNVGIFDESLEFEDYDMWLRVTSKYPIAYIDKPLAFYRIHDSNISNSSKIMLKGALQSIRKQYRTGPVVMKKSKLALLIVKFVLTAIKNRAVKHTKIKSKRFY